MAYVVETKKQQKMLEEYETNVYAVESIQVTAEGEVVGGGRLCGLVMSRS